MVPTGQPRTPGSISVRDKRLLCSPKCPERLRTPSKLLCVGTAGSFPEGKAAVAWSWPLKLYLVPRFRISAVIPPLLHVPSWRSHGHHLYLLSCWEVHEKTILVICIKVGTIQSQYHTRPYVNTPQYRYERALRQVHCAFQFRTQTTVKVRWGGNASDLRSRSAWFKSRPEHRLPSLRYRDFPRSIHVCILECTSDWATAACVHYFSKSSFIYPVIRCCNSLRYWQRR
jgi:hypothetical protein